jgi:D-alanyl-D-alanine carboxypeptidase
MNINNGKIQMKTLLSHRYILLLLFIALCNSGCVNKNRTYSSQQLQAVVNKYLQDKKNILGAIVKVDVQGKKSFEAVSGYFDLSRKTNVHLRDKFIIGSVTKVFTAVLVHQLIEQEKVELQKPIIDYLPVDWAAVLSNIRHGNEITVEHALSHRSGLADVTETEEFRKMLMLESSKPWKPIDILKLTNQQREPKFKPGKGYDYCNTNYLLLGMLVEHVTKQPFGESMKKNIFERLGMDNTFLSEGTFGSGKSGIIHGYYKTDDKIYDGQKVSVGWAQASGGIISTADDLIKFFKALVSKKLFERKETFEQMVRLVGGNEQYGLGLMIFDDPEIGMYYGHGGNFCGTRTMLAYFPKHQTTIVVCHTYDDEVSPGAEELMKEVMKNIFDEERNDTNTTKADVPDIFENNSRVIENEDKAAFGKWDFDLKELWSINNVDGHSIENRFIFNVGSDGQIYILDPLSGKIFVLDLNGKLLFSSSNEEEQIGSAAEMFLASDCVNVFEMGNTVNRIKLFDKKGKLKNSFNIIPEVSPRIFIDREKYVAVRSEIDFDKKPVYETLELLELNNEKVKIIGKFRAEENLIVSTKMTLGNAHVLLDDVELFPKLIVHPNKGGIYLGRSDRYLIKKIDLEGNQTLAFAIKGRNNKPLPNNFKENKISGIGLVGGKEISETMKKEIFDGIPDHQVFFTNITTDEQDLIYVFVPDIGNLKKQGIDIFSQEGKYLYNGVIEFSKGLEIVRSFIINGEYLYFLAKSADKKTQLIKYRINTPKGNK